MLPPDQNKNLKPICKEYPYARTLSMVASAAAFAGYLIASSSPSYLVAAALGGSISVPLIVGSADNTRIRELAATRSRHGADYASRILRQRQLRSYVKCMAFLAALIGVVQITPLKNLRYDKDMAALRSLPSSLHIPQP